MLLITRYYRVMHLIDIVGEQQALRNISLGADICAFHDLRYGRSLLTRFLKE